MNPGTNLYQYNMENEETLNINEMIAAIDLSNSTPFSVYFQSNFPD